LLNHTKIKKFLRMEISRNIKKIVKVYISISK